MEPTPHPRAGGVPWQSYGFGCRYAGLTGSINHFGRPQDKDTCKPDFSLNALTCSSINSYLASEILFPVSINSEGVDGLVSRRRPRSSERAHADDKSISLYVKYLSGSRIRYAVRGLFPTFNSLFFSPKSPYSLSISLTMAMTIRNVALLGVSMTSILCWFIGTKNITGYWCFRGTHSWCTNPGRLRGNCHSTQGFYQPRSLRGQEH